MMHKIYSELTSLHKILCLIKNSVNYKILSLETPDNGLSQFLDSIIHSLNFIEDAPFYFQPNTEDIEFLSNLVKQFNSLSKRGYDIELAKILANKNQLDKLLHEFLDKFRHEQTNNIDTTANDFLLFINDIRSYRVLANTQEFSDSYKIEISKIKNELNKTQNEYTNINGIYEDIKNKNEKFNYFIDADNNLELKKLYEDIYTTEIQQANSYRSYATKIFIGVGSIIIFILFCGLIQNFLALTQPSKYDAVKYGINHLIRFVGLFALTVPAWYFAKESNKHRQVAYKAKILGTELNAFPYYVKELSNEERIKMRITLADKFFGQELYSDKKANNSEIQEQSKLTLEALKTAATLLPKKTD